MSRKVAFVLAVILAMASMLTVAFAAVETADFEGLGYTDEYQIAETLAIDGLRFSTAVGGGMDYRTLYGEGNTASVIAHYAGSVAWVEFRLSDGADFSLTSLYYNNFYASNAASVYRFNGYSDGAIVYTKDNVDVSTSGTITFSGWNSMDTVRISAVSGTAIDVAACFDNIVYEKQTVSPVPYVEINQTLTVVEGGTGTISNTNLKAADNDSDVSVLRFTVTSAPSHGRVESTDAPGTAISTFMQTDINSGKIRYVHDHSDTTSDSFVFKVSDGTNELTNQTFHITVTPVYDDPIPEGASVATFDDLTYGNNTSIPYTTAIDGFLFRSSADLGMLYMSSGGQDNTPALMTQAPGDTKIPGLSIKKEDGSRFKLISIYLYDPSSTGSSEYTFDGYQGTEKIFTKTGVNVKTAATVTFNWENIDEIRVTAVTGTAPDIAAYFDNIIYQNINSAPTDITLSSNTIAENSATGTVIGTFSTTDANAASGDTFTYSMVSGTGSTDNASFSIDGSTLKLGTASLDYETKITYYIRVRSTDSGSLYHEKEFAVTVTDVDESVILTTADVAGIVAPAAGALPATYDSLTAGAVSYTVTRLSWQNTDGTAATLVNNRFKAASVYKAEIDLTAASGYKFQSGSLTPTVNAGTAVAGTVSGGDVSGNKLTFTVTFDTTAPLAVAGITVTAQPVLSYVEGQTLDLTGLTVTLTYNDTSTETNIVPSQFAAKGITASPSAGTALTRAAHDGHTVGLSCNGYLAQTSALSVAAATYTISVSPTSLTFGSAVEGYAAPTAKTVTVTNNGNSTVTLSLPTAADYTLTALSATTLASGASATFTVQPKTDLGVGDHNATITVNTNHGTSADVSATFTVEATTYSISVDPTSLAFGSAVEGYAAPSAQTVTITNNGNSTVTLSLPTVTDYTLSALSATTLASGASATFTVLPKTDLGVGDHNATITVSTNHGTSTDVSATFAVEAATYAISADPTSLAFGSAVEGYAAPSAQTVTITNNGNSTVTLSLPTVTDYTLSALSATTLASGARATFTVQPKTDLGVGDHNATITVSTNHGTSTDVSATFTVQAATYVISANPTQKDFGSITEGDSTPAAVTVTVTNIGSKPVTLNQPTATHYAISALSATDIASAATATFTIAPTSGLGAGEYNETIDITGSNGASAQLEVLFTVNEAPRYEITADPVSVTFPTLAKDYLPPDVQTVTITNTGNQNITLFQPSAANYTFGDLSATALAPTGTATFTIMPKSGLDVGVWDYTLHIQGSYSVDASVDIAFTCTVPHVYPILKGNGSTYQRNDPSSPLVTMTGEGELETFTGLTINGELVNDANYDEASGSTIITLHRDYLDSLRAGTYTMRIHHTEGYTEGRFIVYDAMPITGDNSAILIFSLLTVFCLITLVSLKRKRAR